MANPFKYVSRRRIKRANRSTVAYGRIERLCKSEKYAWLVRHSQIASVICIKLPNSRAEVTAVAMDNGETVEYTTAASQRCYVPEQVHWEVQRRFLEVFSLPVDYRDKYVALSRNLISAVKA